MSAPMSYLIVCNLSDYYYYSLFLLLFPGRSWIVVSTLTVQKLPPLRFRQESFHSPLF